MKNSLYTTTSAATLQLENLYSICYTPLATFLGSGEAACILQRIHYWLQNTKAGFRLKDGVKWIYNGYNEWQQQFPWLSKYQIQRFILQLEAIGWLLSDRFYSLKREVGFLGRCPDLHEDNQKKWYRIDYVKVFEDTGFDLLFDQEEKSTPGEKTAETLENSQCANLHNAMCKSAQSSIQNITKPLNEESETLGNKFDNEEEVYVNGWESNSEVGESRSKPDSHKDQLSAAPRNKTLKITKRTPAMKLGARPPRQSPKLQYPEGAWLTDNGYLNADFVRDRAALWRTGDTLKSQAFGKMTIEDVVGLVCGHYAKPENHAKLEIDWNAYVTKNQRYFDNVQQRVDAGINIPLAEQQQVVSKLPAVFSTPVEPAFEQAQLPNTQLPQLSPGLDPTTITVDVTASIPAPEGCDNPDSYRLYSDPEGVNWMKRFASAPPKVEKPKPTSEEMAAAQALVEQLKARKAEEAARKKKAADL